MLKSMKVALTVSALTALSSMSAQANINTSLAHACAKAKQTTEAVNSLSGQEGAYTSKLASFYAGTSCHGKVLLSKQILQRDEAVNKTQSSEPIANVRASM